MLNLVIIKNHLANNAVDFFAILPFTSVLFLYLRSGIVNCKQFTSAMLAVGSGEYGVASGRTRDDRVKVRS